MGDLQTDTLTKRLDRLERENRRWKGLGVGAVAVLSLVVLVGATGSKVADEVRARKFILMDERGKRQGVWWGLKEGLTALDLLDKEEKLRLRLVVSPSGPELQLIDVNGLGRVWLGMAKGGSPFLRLQDRNGSKAVLGSKELEYSQTGVIEKRPASSLILFNKDGKVIWSAP